MRLTRTGFLRATGALLVACADGSKSTELEGEMSAQASTPQGAGGLPASAVADAGMEQTPGSGGLAAEDSGSGGTPRAPEGSAPPLATGDCGATAMGTDIFGNHLSSGGPHTVRVTQRQLE
jgi:hypothetical protein